MAIIEEKSIDFIPEGERHGSVWNLARIWLAINFGALCIGTGAVNITLGLNLAWSILAVIIGNLLGALLMAAHSAQGPHLGIPQMIQSRAQFGVVGAIIPLILVVIMYVGFASSSLIYNAQTFVALFPTAPLNVVIILTSIPTAIIAIIGYDAIHTSFKWLANVLTVLFIIVTAYAFFIPVAPGTFTFGPVDFGMFLLAVSISATWQVAFAPYVADYSRYLPRNTRTSTTFWMTYGGTVIGAIWMMSLGAFLATQLPNFFDNQMAALSKLFPIPSLFLIVCFLGMILACTMNLYGSFMATITTLQPICGIKGSQKNRVIIICAVSVVICLISVYASANFMTLYGMFLQVLLYFMIPWTSINLVDFYFIKHGKYNVEAMFDSKGQYGRINWKTLFVYFSTVVIEIPFISATWYTGPFATALHGGDVAWFVGGIYAAILYYFLNRKNIIAKSSNEQDSFKEEKNVI
jgi:NCS1 family nucleobase:cation symporter-1